MAPISYRHVSFHGCIRGFGVAGATYRDPDDAGMALDPCLVSGAEEGEGADARRGEELDGEDGVDLANELVSDIDGSFSDGAAKLNGKQHMLASPIASFTFATLHQRAPPKRTLKSSGKLSSLLLGAPNRPCVSSREADPSA